VPFSNLNVAPFLWKNMAKKKKNKILKFPERKEINIALIIALLIAMYLIYTIFAYLTRGHVSIHEVRMGKIANNNHYEAMAIRDETVVYSDDSGHPFYYTSNGSRVGVQSKIYGLDKAGSLTKKLKSAAKTDSKLSEKNLFDFENTIKTFMEGYNGTDYSKVYVFNSDISDQVQKAYNDENVSNLEGDISAAVTKGTYHEYTPANTGFLIYSLDGYEGTTIDNFVDMKAKKDINPISDLRKKNKLDVKEPVYKLINSDDWKLTMCISHKVAETLKDKPSVRIKFDYDGSTTTANTEIKKIGSKEYLILSLSNSMERFANLRFVSIELMINQQQGLKIPNSAIDTKEFYVIPKDYFLLGNNARDLGLMIRKTEDEFESPEIYYATKDSYYILKQDLGENPIIVIPNSMDTFNPASTLVKRKGVYNVNKGFADFKIINILYSSDDYSIISDDGSYGITLYDHIALDGKSIKNGKIIY
jgi:hypothetical protein